MNTNRDYAESLAGAAAQISTSTSPLTIAIMHDRCALFHGDSAQLGTVLGPNTIDAIITDPPAGIAFMGADWDKDKGGRDAWIDWLAKLMGPAFAALKPGGYALVWALPRTSHWTAMALEDCGFEIRDVHHHIFGTGFPKSLDISKAIDDHLGAERKVIGERKGTGNTTFAGQEDGKGLGPTVQITEAATPEAAKWAGFGTAFKPAVEHWILARKPLEGTYAQNVLAYGVGGLNIDACRIGNETRINAPAGNTAGAGTSYMMAVHGMPQDVAPRECVGRWPAHLSLEHAECCGESCVLGCPVRLLDEQSGDVGAAAPVKGTEPSRAVEPGTITGTRKRVPGKFHADKGGASRFFYVAKGSRSEKDDGLDHLTPKTGGEATGREDDSAGTKNPRAGAGRTGGARNFHPTVKSIDLMRWLIRLITPPGGVVLDVFAGSGTTGIAALAEGCDFVGVEQGGKDGEYIPIIVGRLSHALAKYGDAVERT